MSPIVCICFGIFISGVLCKYFAFCLQFKTARLINIAATFIITVHMVREILEINLIVHGSHGQGVCAPYLLKVPQNKTLE